MSKMQHPSDNNNDPSFNNNLPASPLGNPGETGSSIVESAGPASYQRGDLGGSSSSNHSRSSVGYRRSSSSSASPHRRRSSYNKNNNNNSSRRVVSRRHSLGPLGEGDDSTTTITPTTSNLSNPFFFRFGMSVGVVRKAFSVDDYEPAGSDDYDDDYDDEHVNRIDSGDDYDDDEDSDEYPPIRSTASDPFTSSTTHLQPSLMSLARSTCTSTSSPLGWWILGILSISVLAAVVTRVRHYYHDKNLNGIYHEGLKDAPVDYDASICQDPVYKKLFASTTLERLEHGAVAADHALCSQMGVDVLQIKGGNAVDAAVTVALCLGVANPGSSGLGGGAFILVHAPLSTTTTTASDLTKLKFDDQRDNGTTSTTGRVTHVIDCREVAPLAASKHMYENNRSSVFGGLAVAVPGELRGLELAHALHGSLAWRDLVEPVARLATKGVEVNANLAHEIEFMATLYSKANNNLQDFGLRGLLTRGDSWSNPLRYKELLQNQKLGELLLDVADKGADALYIDRADVLAADIRAAGGIVVPDDITSYRATLRSPVVAHNVFGFQMAGVPPPSSGGAAIIGAARFLSGYVIPLAAFAFSDTLTVHLVSEALKHVFAIRMSLSDPAYNTKTVQDAVRDLTSGPYMESLRSITRDNTTLPLSQYGGKKWAQLKDTDGSANTTDAKEGDRHYNKLRRRHRRRLGQDPFGYLNDAGTSHFSIVDKDGNAVAMTTSVNTYFGSNVVSKSTGIVLGNTMDDFAKPPSSSGSQTANYFGVLPSEANYIEPGKKPLSSMSPTMVFRKSSSTTSSDTDGSGLEYDGDLGELTLVIGASGGPKIITAVLQVFVYTFLLGKPLFESVVHPRIHDQLIYHGAAATAVEKSTVTVQPDIGGLSSVSTSSIEVSQRTQDALKRRNHQLINIDYAGTVQAISVDLETKLLTATCDVRKGGSPAGY